MTPNLQEGDVLAGKYRIERVLGKGGMGLVVAAMHIQLDERVALKFLLPEALLHREAVARFAREARAAAKIKSQHVARVTDVATLEDGTPYMVMEHLTGADLAVRLAECKRFEISEAVEFVLQACEALAEAHSLGIVHRDLKPGNLFLTRLADGSPCIKILDFGISKVTAAIGNAPEANMTKTSAALGSPLYMSPEQMTSARDVDGRTDIWAVGVILHELIAGRPPFDAESLGQLVSLILNEPPRPLLDVRPDAPPELARVIAHCLEKDRTRRFSSIRELAHALLPFAPPSAVSSIERISYVAGAASARESGSVSPTGPSLASSGVKSTDAVWGRTSASNPTRIGLVSGMAVLIALISGGVFWKLHAMSSTPNAELTTAAIAPSNVTDPVIPSSPPSVSLPVPQVATQALPVASAPAPAVSDKLHPTLRAALPANSISGPPPVKSSPASGAIASTRPNVSNAAPKGSATGNELNRLIEDRQ